MIRRSTDHVTRLHLLTPDDLVRAKALGRPFRGSRIDVVAVELPWLTSHERALAEKQLPRWLNACGCTAAGPVFMGVLLVIQLPAMAAGAWWPQAAGSFVVAMTAAILTKLAVLAYAYVRVHLWLDAMCRRADSGG